jgi:hypothetical protein
MPTWVVIADVTLAHGDVVKGSYPFWISVAEILVFNMLVLIGDLAIVLLRVRKK